MSKDCCVSLGSYECVARRSDLWKEDIKRHVKSNSEDHRMLSPQAYDFMSLAPHEASKVWTPQFETAPPYYCWYREFGPVKCAPS
jgi:hypothetical protein